MGRICDGHLSGQVRQAGCASGGQGSRPLTQAHLSCVVLGCSDKHGHVSRQLDVIDLPRVLLDIHQHLSRLEEDKALDPLASVLSHHSPETQDQLDLTLHLPHPQFNL